MLTSFNKLKIMPEAAHDNWRLKVKTINRFHKLIINRGANSLECFNRATNQPMKKTHRFACKDIDSLRRFWLVVTHFTRTHKRLIELDDYSKQILIVYQTKLNDDVDWLLFTLKSSILTTFVTRTIYQIGIKVICGDKWYNRYRVLKCYLTVKHPWPLIAKYHSLEFIQIRKERHNRYA